MRPSGCEVKPVFAREESAAGSDRIRSAAGPAGEAVGGQGLNRRGQHRPGNGRSVLQSPLTTRAHAGGRPRLGPESGCGGLTMHGPLAARKVFEEARKAGITEITLRRAKAREGV